MLRLIKFQITIFFLLLGISMYAQEVELVKTIPFLGEDDRLSKSKEGLLQVGVRGEAIKLFSQEGEALNPIIYESYRDKKSIDAFIRTKDIKTLVLVRNGKQGFVNYKGEEVGPFNYDEIKPWSCNCAIAKRGENHYVIDTLGNEIFLDFDIDFGEARVVATDGLIRYKQSEEVTMSNGIDFTLFVYRYIMFDFDKGTAKGIEGMGSLFPIFYNDFNCKYGVFKDSIIKEDSKAKRGLINSKGEVVVPAAEDFSFKRVGDLIYFVNINGTFMLDDFGNVTPLLNDMVSLEGWNRDSLSNFFIWTEKIEGGELMYGIIDNQFKKITPAKYRWLETEGGGVFVASNSTAETYKLIDENETKIVEDDFLRIKLDYRCGILAKSDSSNYQWLDATGDHILSFEYVSADSSAWSVWNVQGNFESGVIAVRVEKDGDFIFCDKNKKQYWIGDYDGVKFTEKEEVIIVRKNGKSGAIDFEGNSVVELADHVVYEKKIFEATGEGGVVKSGLVILNNDEKSFYNFKEKRKSEIDDVSNLYEVGDGYFWVKSGSKWQVYKLKE